MDRHDQQAPKRGRRAARHLSIPARLEWTRQPGTGPDSSVLGALAGHTVAELGCGSGHNLACLVAVHGAAGIGIDRDPAKINRARDLYGSLDNLAFVRGDAAAVLAAMPPSTIEVVLSIFGAFSFSPPGPLLRAAAHALRPGGRLAITLRADEHHDHVIVLTRQDDLAGRERAMRGKCAPSRSRGSPPGRLRWT